MAGREIPLSALVMGFDKLDFSVDQPLRALQRDIGHVKAGLLYADRVGLATQGAYAALGLLGEGPDEDKGAEERLRASLAQLPHTAQEATRDFFRGLGARAFWVPDPFEAGVLTGSFAASGEAHGGLLPLTDSATLERMREGARLVFEAPETLSAEIRKAAERTANESEAELTERLRQVAADASQPEVAAWLNSLIEWRSGGAARSATGGATDRGRLIVEVLGGLPAFPNADWDVLLDVRDRLQRSRTRLRATVAELEEELRELPEAEFPAACERLRRRTVGPALAEIEEELDDLGAVPTLLRVAQDAPTMTAAAANLALTAADAATFGLGTLAHAIASAPALAAGAREALHQRTRRRALSGRPFWIVHAAGANSGTPRRRTVKSSRR